MFGDVSFKFEMRMSKSPLDGGSAVRGHFPGGPIGSFAFSIAMVESLVDNV